MSSSRSSVERDVGVEAAGLLDDFPQKTAEFLDPRLPVPLVADLDEPVHPKAGVW